MPTILEGVWGPARRPAKPWLAQPRRGAGGSNSTGETFCAVEVVICSSRAALDGDALHDAHRRVGGHDAGETETGLVQQRTVFLFRPLLSTWHYEHRDI